MSTRKKTGFVDIDTQRDFMVSRGRLYVQGARTIGNAIRRLVAHAGQRGYRLFSSVDAHSEDDPEFDQFPPHCVQGTRGQQKIRGTVLDDHVVVAPDRKLSPQAIDDLLGHDQIIIEKQAFEIFDNPNTTPILRASGCTRFLVFGVATDYCVRAAVLGLRTLDYPVTVVEDAIRGVAPDTTEQALAEMRDAGARFKTLDQVLR
ncbi:MAG: cysteine hydrolase family protein [Planctomycetota bacterium]